MSNKWHDVLLGKTNYEAFKIIWSPKRNLTGEQRQRLVKYHQEINSGLKEKLFNDALDPSWWVVGEEDGKRNTNGTK